jgi:tetratricopeptide (TPR) repeat protein
MQRHHQEALALARDTQDGRDLMDATNNLGYALLFTAVLAGAADPDAAEDLFRESLSIADELGDQRGIARAKRGLGLVAGIARGDLAAAVPLFQASVAPFEELGDRWELTESLVALGNGFRFSGDMARAREHYLHALDINVDARSRQTSTSLLRMAAGLESHAGRHEHAARLWGAAEAARMIHGALDPPNGPRLIGDPEGAARRAIGDAAVDQALTEGRAMDLAAAVAYAHTDD